MCTRSILSMRCTNKTQNAYHISWHVFRLTFFLSVFIALLLYLFHVHTFIYIYIYIVCALAGLSFFLARFSMVFRDAAAFNVVGSPLSLRDAYTMRVCVYQDIFSNPHPQTKAQHFHIQIEGENILTNTFFLFVGK